MHTKEIGENLFLIDLETCGYKNLIASYVLKGEKIVIVETGPTSSIPNLLSGLEELDVNPNDVDYVAVSHVHIDHVGGAGTLVKKLRKAKIIVHSKGVPHLIDPSKLWLASKKTLGEVADMFGKPEPVPENRIVAASENWTLSLGKGLRLSAAAAPGHASHNVAYYEERNRGVFPGDGAGAYLPEFKAVFPTTPPPFRPDFALISLDKLISLNPKFLYYSHFGVGTDAVTRLRNYALQIKMWLGLVQEDLKRDQKSEAIREHIFREDESIRNAVPWLKENLIQKRTLINNSVQGFIEFAQNPQI